MSNEVESKSIALNVKVCQNCRFHTNNPSFCSLKEKHVNRKDTCDKCKTK